VSKDWTLYKSVCRSFLSGQAEAKALTLLWDHLTETKKSSSVDELKHKGSVVGRRNVHRDIQFDENPVYDDFFK
jgi:hypothetical protein